MSNHIEAILFDMGGTLRRTSKRSAEERQKKVQQILDILGAPGSSAEFIQLLTERFDVYQRWSDNTLIEANEVELWTRWMLPEWPSDQVSEYARLFNRIWRDAIAERTLFPETKDVIIQLFRNGYRLGLVSNTTSSEEAPNALEGLGIAGYFEVIALSCLVGLKKPDPAIQLDATRRMGVDPARCAYVGNKPKRDVASAKKAGFSKTVIIQDHNGLTTALEDPTLVPDHLITNLWELLEIFPPLVEIKPRSTLKTAHPSQWSDSLLCEASLSTMWGIKKFPGLDDFFLAAGRMGFSHIELNHAVTSSMLTGADLNAYRFSSVHEPCPADISTETLKKRDWMISSTDEDCRRQGVEAIKKSIDLASELGVKIIVTHAGHVDLDNSAETQLRKLYQAGQADSPQFSELKGGLEDFRAHQAEAHFEAVIKSLRELLDYAGQRGIRLGLENRFHYLDIPTQDEMARLLELADSERLGFIYDSGHGMAMSLLGFFDNEIWLKRFGSRLLGTHLQDAIGVNDHYAPGLGDIDFRMIAKYLPKDAFRTCEVQHSNSTEQVKNALKYLVDTGCVNRIL